MYKSSKRKTIATVTFTPVFCLENAYFKWVRSDQLKFLRNLKFIIIRLLSHLWENRLIMYRLPSGAHVSAILGLLSGDIFKTWPKIWCYMVLRNLMSQEWIQIDSKSCFASRKMILWYRVSHWILYRNLLILITQDSQHSRKCKDSRIIRWFNRHRLLSHFSLFRLSGTWNRLQKHSWTACNKSFWNQRDQQNQVCL